MDPLDALAAADHEQVVFCHDSSAGYRGIIAIHSTALGPAVGGVRMWRYASLGAALTDVLRLSRGMTYKSALAGLDLGGGKSVIILDADRQYDAAAREALLRAHGRFVDSLGGRYVAAEDVGTTPADMETLLRETKHVAGLAANDGDPSPHTALGVFRAMQGGAEARWGTRELAGRTVAIQGCGNVGAHLARLLHEADARLVVTDVDPARITRVAVGGDAEVVMPDRIYDVPADVFAPCALGGILDDATIPRLRVGLVCGAANNQLLEPRHGDALAERGILYVPDFVANAGGVINGARELLGWSADRTARQIDALGDTVRQVLGAAASLGVSPQRAAEALAEERLDRRG
jgi:leucine dehydrogenase